MVYKCFVSLGNGLNFRRFRAIIANHFLPAAHLLALPHVRATLLFGGCSSLTVKALLLLAVTRFSFWDKGKKSRSEEVKIQPFLHYFLWVFSLIKMQESARVTHYIRDSPT